MTLAANTEARYPASLLVPLTNPDDRSATTVDAAKLAAAAADAEARFEVLTGLDYDDDQPSHVAAAVPGVLYFLVRYGGRDDAAAGSLRDQFEAGCRDLALAAGSRKLGTWATDARWAVTRETQDARPPFDRGSTRDYVIGWPDGVPVDDLPSGG